MNKLGLKLLAFSAGVLGMAGAANAVPVTWTDYAGSPSYVTRSYSYHHSILDQGYTPTVDSIYGASLSILLSDDSLFDGEERVGFALDTASGGSSNVDFGAFSFNVTSLLSDGWLNVTINALRGDFLFLGSRLTVRGEERGNGTPATPVPEPATLATFGIGLLVMGLLARRRKKSLLAV